MNQSNKLLRRGDFRAPKNAFLEAQGSIHNDSVASKLGFKGGTVPGSVHMDQFMPMVMNATGPKWFETGDMSLYFTQATVDQERVRAEVEGDGPRLSLRMFNEAEVLICTGTASTSAPDAESEVQHRMRDLPLAAHEQLRILHNVRIGDETHDTPLKVTVEALDMALKNITERLDVYSKDNVLPPSHVVKLAHITRPVVHSKVKQAVGLFGALEVRHYKGPLFAGRDYVGRSKVLKLTESPKTEAIWYDVIITDPLMKEDVASVIFMIRFMKASSPLWTQSGAA